MKTNISLLLIVIALSLAGLYQLDQTRKYKERSSRYLTNIKHLVNRATLTKNELGQSVAQVGVLQMTLREAEETNQLQQKELKSLKIRLKDVKSVNTSHINTNINVPIEVRDSATSKCFNYKDPYLSISGCVSDSTLSDSAGYVKASLQDTLSTIVHIEPKKILWIFSYGIKEVKATTTNKNPYISITNTNHIEIINRRR